MIRVRKFTSRVNTNFCLFVCLFGLMLYVLSQSIAMVMSGRSVHLTTLFLGQVNQYFVHMVLLVTDNNPS